MERDLESDVRAQTAPQERCEPLIGTSEAAKLLNCSRKTVERLASRHQIPAVRLGQGKRAYWKFRASVIDTWLRGQMGETSARSSG